MRTYLILLSILFIFPIQVRAQDDSSTSRKSFFDFSKYVTVEPPAVVEDEVEVESMTEWSEEVSEEDLIEQAKMEALQDRAGQLKELRERRKEIFEEYNSTKQKVDEQYNELSKQLSENSTNTRMSFDLNKQINVVKAEKKRLLENFRAESAKLSQQIDDLQGRKQMVEDIQPTQPKIQPVRVKPSMSIREKLKRQGTVSTRKKPVGGNRRIIPAVGAGSQPPKKSYIKKTGRNANSSKAKPKSQGRLLDQLKTGR